MIVGSRHAHSRYRGFTIVMATLCLASSAYAEGNEPQADPHSGKTTEGVAPPVAPSQAVVSPPVQGSVPDQPTTQPFQGAASPTRDGRDDAPVVALTHSAFGTRANKIGAQAFGFGQSAAQGSEGGGGLMIHGSPLDRLTLLATGQRYLDGHFAPSASLAYRLVGSLDQSWALAAMGTYKAEGFAEIEGEVELGVLFSMLQNRWHFDANAVAGGGLEESEEFDAEAKLRAGYDVTDWLRVGADARGRYRLRGDKLLAGERKGDFIGGPQLIAGWSRFYGSALIGASTADVASGVGAAGWLAFGGVVP
jgi:hypothetical protein